MRQSQEGRALRQFTLSTGKSAGRNSSGRITVFHRGGGSKRLQRRIDLKRSTSSIGIVERIEYDPNRSSVGVGERNGHSCDRLRELDRQWHLFSSSPPDSPATAPARKKLRLESCKRFAGGEGYRSRSRVRYGSHYEYISRESHHLSLALDMEGYAGTDATTGALPPPLQEVPRISY
ncbi:hypothetical protein Patl1_14459 [Pistacia atlantica]|uniref:Uncharacterized protein n=1 Tax=Pistacia atlantica TaxID=434234 RepID=A0ACC1AW90_9ROSI|nr:hypothetical protein Patl1_14459 [Pistacia atlantica]